MNAWERKERAEELFLNGYNCTQSVVLAFEDVLPLDHETLTKVSSSFGGGMGRLREVCGTVSGMAMVAGFLYGYSTPGNVPEKSEHYARIQELAHRFEELNGSIVCRELLGLSCKHDSPQASKRTAEYYRKRPCKELAGQAAQIMAEYMEQQSS